MKTCFFLGHRNEGMDILPSLKQAVEQHIVTYDIAHFWVGHYGRFNALAAQTVLQAKQRHPWVTLSLLLPYLPTKQPGPVPEGFDQILFPPSLDLIPSDMGILRANCYGIDSCTHLIARVGRPTGALTLLSYALAREARGFLHVTELPAPKPRFLA